VRLERLDQSLVIRLLFFKFKINSIVQIQNTLNLNIKIVFEVQKLYNFLFVLDIKNIKYFLVLWVSLSSAVRLLCLSEIKKKNGS
jgi:hypothetical protein